jgi:hypothetical protein
MWEKSASNGLFILRLRLKRRNLNKTHLMKSGIIFSFFLLFSALLFGQTDITGRWVAPGEKGSGEVEVYIGGDGKYYARFIKAYDSGQDQKIRAKMEEEGQNEILILEKLVYTGDETWEKGTVFSVSRQMKFDCKIVCTDPQHLKITAYYGFGLFSKTFTWYRD